MVRQVDRSRAIQTRKKTSARQPLNDPGQVGPIPDWRGSQLLNITPIIDMAQGRRSMPIPEIFGRHMRHRVVAIDESEHTEVRLIDDALAKYFIASPRTPK